MAEAIREAFRTTEKRWLAKVAEIPDAGWGVSTGALAFLRDAPECVRADADVMKLAVQKDGYALEYASPELKDDFELVMDAVRALRKERARFLV